LEGVIRSLFGTLFTTERRPPGPSYTGGDRLGGPAAWIERVMAECRDKLAPLFQFTAEERAFLDAVLDRGEIDASPVGVPEAVRAAIEACPALRWEAQNVKAWKSGDKSLVPRVRRGRRPPGEPPS